MIKVYTLLWYLFDHDHVTKQTPFSVTPQISPSVVLSNRNPLSSDHRLNGSGHRWPASTPPPFRPGLTLSRFMDPSDSHSHSQEQEAPKKNGVVFVILRWVLSIVFPFLLFLLIPFLVGLLILMFADFSIPNPISLPSQCKIVSTG